MTKARLSIVIDKDILTKVRKEQAARIQKTDKGCSMSQIINEKLAKAFK